MVFGDVDNDVGMFKVVGDGVVMVNGFFVVKVIVDYEMVFNEEDGVVCYLIKMFVIIL